MKCIGAVTIGQSPRPDITAEVADFFDQDIRILESGALDAFTKDQIREILPQATGPLLVTRLRDGSEVKIGEDFLIPHLQRCIEELQRDADLLLLLCTESLPAFQSERLIIYPGRLLFNAVRALGVGRIGVLTPAAEQQHHQSRRWREVVPSVIVEAASPYGTPEHLRESAIALGGSDVELIVMDCLGYSRSMKEVVKACSHRPVLLARSVLARMTAEFI